MHNRHQSGSTSEEDGLHGEGMGADLSLLLAAIDADQSNALLSSKEAVCGDTYGFDGYGNGSKPKRGGGSRGWKGVFCDDGLSAEDQVAL